MLYAHRVPTSPPASLTPWRWRVCWSDSVHLLWFWWWQANTERLRQSIATKAEVAASKSVVEIYARYDNENTHGMFLGISIFGVVDMCELCMYAYVRAP